MSENIALRERAIRLQYEIDKGPSNSILKDVGSLKGRLETKLAELGELVHDLSKIQLESRRSPRPKSASKNSPKRSPDQKNWKNTFTLSEVTGGVDGRLPPILEDKYFPRKTLEYIPNHGVGNISDMISSAEELSGALFNTANSNDSPELGPPPIAHFEEGDPVKFDPNGISEVFTSSRNPQPPMFANLESRRKRRETSNLTQTMLEENVSHPPQPSKFTDTSLSTEQPFKSGAKRKLNTREDDFKSAPLVDSDIDGCLSSRKALDSTKSSELRQDYVKLGSPARRKVSQGLDEFDVVKEQESSNKSRRALSSSRSPSKNGFFIYTKGLMMFFRKRQLRSKIACKA